MSLFINLGQYWYSQWLVVYSALNHYVNHCVLIVIWSITKQKLVVIKKNNAFRNVVCKMGAILYRSQLFKNQAIGSFRTIGKLLCKNICIYSLSRLHRRWKDYTRHDIRWCTSNSIWPPRNRLKYSPLDQSDCLKGLQMTFETFFLWDKKLFFHLPNP